MSAVSTPETSHVAESYRLKKNLYLYPPTHLQNNKRLTLKRPTLSLTRTRDNTLLECRLLFTLPGQQLQRLETQQLLNLAPELRHHHSDRPFSPENDITLEAILKPQLLTQLQEHSHSPQAIATYLINVRDQAPTPPDPNAKASEPTEEADTFLLSTSSWLAISVTQQHTDGEIGYRTFWDYVNPTILNQTLDAGDRLANGLSDFFSEWITANWADSTEALATEITEELTQLFTELDTLLTPPPAEPLQAPTEPPPETKKQPGKLLPILLSFFSAESWPVAPIAQQTHHQSALQLAFQGNHGQWTCYAHTHETRQEFLFYSISPTPAPESKRLAMAEFLTRANYGLTLGNFEMSFSTGEIHFKTSLDVEGDRLSTALVRRLVYANVLIMDQYLPGIMAIIYSDTTPTAAIALIEQPVEQQAEQSVEQPSANPSDIG